MSYVGVGTGVDKALSKSRFSEMLNEEIQKHRQNVKELTTVAKYDRTK